MNYPTNIKYTSEHEWIRIEGDEAIVGITDYAQDQLGDIVFIDIPTDSTTKHFIRSYSRICNRNVLWNQRNFVYLRKN